MCIYDCVLSSLGSLESSPLDYVEYQYNNSIQYNTTENLTPDYVGTTTTATLQLTMSQNGMVHKQHTVGQTDQSPLNREKGTLPGLYAALLT